MQIPHFPEASHPIVRSLSSYSDQELLSAFESYPNQGRYFTAIFCRYSAATYTMIIPFVRSPNQVNYLFALTWQRIFGQMRGLTISKDGDAQYTSVGNWLIYTAAECIYQSLPLNEAVDYDLQANPLPLRCYVEQALEALPPSMRFAVVMAEKFKWSDIQITKYLQAETEDLSLEDVQGWLKQGYQTLQTTLPEDIRRLYLE